MASSSFDATWTARASSIVAAVSAQDATRSDAYGSDTIVLPPGISARDVFDALSPSRLQRAVLSMGDPSRWAAAAPRPGEPFTIVVLGGSTTIGHECRRRVIPTSFDPARSGSMMDGIGLFGRRLARRTPPVRPALRSHARLLVRNGSDNASVPRCRQLMVPCSHDVDPQCAWPARLARLLGSVFGDVFGDRVAVRNLAMGPPARVEPAMPAKPAC